MTIQTVHCLSSLQLKKKKRDNPNNHGRLLVFCGRVSPAFELPCVAYTTSCALASSHFSILNRTIYMFQLNVHPIRWSLWTGDTPPGSSVCMHVRPWSGTGATVHVQLAHRTPEPAASNQLRRSDLLLRSRRWLPDCFRLEEAVRSRTRIHDTPRHESSSRRAAARPLARTFWRESRSTLHQLNAWITVRRPAASVRENRLGWACHRGCCRACLVAGED